jgi:hypothetical protein
LGGCLDELLEDLSANSADEEVLDSAELSDSELADEAEGVLMYSVENFLPYIWGGKVLVSLSIRALLVLASKSLFSSSFNNRWVQPGKVSNSPSTQRP